MKVICELCGCFSTNAEVCSSCGAPIVVEEFDEHFAQGVFQWGWATISIDSASAQERLKAALLLKNVWEEIERFTVLKLLKSQAGRASSLAESVVKLLVRRDICKSLTDTLMRQFESITITFDPIKEIISTAEDANKLLVGDDESRHPGQRR